MAFVRKLLSSVSAIAVFLSGVSGATGSVSSNNPEFAARSSGTSDFGKSRRTGDLLVELILSEGQLTEQSIETGLNNMLAGLTPDQAAKIPRLMRDLRTLGLRPEIEVAAAETLIGIVRKASGRILAAKQAELLVGDIFDQFVTPTKIAMYPNPPARSAGGSPLHETQLATDHNPQEQIEENFAPLMAPEELETLFEPGAGYQL
ncbi:MAG: hypothetical protein O7I42_19475 [Alphaproteobacteria bacterium]|nr:hypothetical protein [Alphaproteobacteria bacterium]